MAESKKMVGKEVAFMKKKGAPKSMIKHEQAEMGAMKKGGKVRKMAAGGEPLPPPPDEVELPKEWFKKKKKMASGGLASGHKSADGIARKGKTKAMQVKMAYGGKC